MHIDAIKRCIHWFIILGLLSTPLPALATVTAELVDGKSVYQFGLHLFNLGDYYRAITELKRFSLLFPQHPQHPEAQALLGLAFEENADIDAAISQFQHLRAISEQTHLKRLAEFKLGELRFQQENYRLAATVFQRFLRQFPEGPLTGRSAYLLGLSLALESENRLSQRALELVPKHTPWSEPANRLQQVLNQPPDPPVKSPLTAGILAGVLPGAGHLYLGKPRHAITALLLNGLFLTGAVFSFLEGLEATGIILLYFETGWYLGNINSAVEGARDFNQHQQQTRHDQLLSTYAPPRLNLRQLQTPGIGLRFSF